jgi:ABC-2 type transport system ATP-binding protein
MIPGVEALRVTYGAVVALDLVTLAIPSGSVTAVVGGDGAGKTSLLRVLAGGLAPSAGLVRRPPPSRIGYVPEGPGVYADLTVDENLAFVASAYRIGRRRAQERAAVLLDACELTDARIRLAAHLSGGMRRKLALACALLPEPHLLVLDEPTTGIDPASRTALWRMLTQAAAGGTAVVVSTTYLDEAERARTVLVLDAGRPLVTGAPDGIVASTPGLVLDADRRGDPSRSWRRGVRWRVWEPAGAVRSGDGMDGGLSDTRPAVVDLEDAVIVAALARREAGLGVTS